MTDALTVHDVLYLRPPRNTSSYFQKTEQTWLQQAGLLLGISEIMKIVIKLLYQLI